MTDMRRCRGRALERCDDGSGLTQSSAADGPCGGWALNTLQNRDAGDEPVAFDLGIGNWSVPDQRAGPFQQLASARPPRVVRICQDQVEHVRCNDETTSGCVETRAASRAPIRPETTVAWTGFELCVGIGCDLVGTLLPFRQ